MAPRRRFVHDREQRRPRLAPSRQPAAPPPRQGPRGSGPRAGPPLWPRGFAPPAPRPFALEGGNGWGRLGWEQPPFVPDAPRAPTKPPSGPGVNAGALSSWDHASARGGRARGICSGREEGAHGRGGLGPAAHPRRARRRRPGHRRRRRPGRAGAVDHQAPPVGGVARVLRLPVLAAGRGPVRPRRASVHRPGARETRNACSTRYATATPGSEGSTSRSLRVRTPVRARSRRCTSSPASSRASRRSASDPDAVLPGPPSPSGGVRLDGGRSGARAGRVGRVLRRFRSPSWPRSTPHQRLRIPGQSARAPARCARSSPARPENRPA
jgi:hypothetical protein